jgi:hypothetical protein
VLKEAAVPVTALSIVVAPVEVKEIFPKSVFDMPFKVGPFQSLQTINTEQIEMTHIGTTQLLIKKIEEQQSTIQSLQSTLQTLLERSNL